jgi:effector-binding domain-containing protein
LDLTETLGYDILNQDGDIELRQYGSYILAQVEASSDMKGATYSGFMKLFNYISGNNTNKAKILMTIPVTEEQVSASEKIPMTAPVTTERSSNDLYMISFVMPSNYSMETLPEPNDKSITFRQVPPHRAAVIKFSGRMKEELADKKIEELKQWLRDNHLEPRSNFIMAQFNPPWIPGFMRHNEIMVEI